MLRCLLKQQEKTFLIYWIKYDGNKILGGFGGDCWTHLFGFPVEWHFNYPKDGRLHYSYKKHSEKDNKEEYFFTAYGDQIKYKNVSSVGVSSAHIINGKLLLNHLLPTEQPCPLDQYTEQAEKCFYFPTTAISIPILPDALDKEIFRTVEDHQDQNAIVIDAEQVKAGILNVSAFICGKSYNISSFKDHWMAQDETKFLRIGLLAMVC